MSFLGFQVQSLRQGVTFRDSPAIDHASLPLAASAAGAAIAEVIAFAPSFKCTVTAVDVVPADALTADNTNFATLEVEKRPAGALGTPVVVAAESTEITGSGDWVAWTPVSLGAVANAELEPGDVLTFNVAKAASGVATPAMVLRVHYTRAASDQGIGVGL